MKENKYDDSAFYQKYSQMPRSVQGLEAAGEWHELKELLPPLQGKTVLDLGCGFGWHCRYAVEQGAAFVTGVDLSKNMLVEARNTTPATNVRYEQAAIEDFAYGQQEYDVVLSSLALHYVAHFGDLCKKIHRSLKAGGSFVFSVEHPIFTAQGSQDWHYDSQRQRQHWPVDNYFTEGMRHAIFLGEPVQKYHKTLTHYMRGLLCADFKIVGFVEPQPEARLLESMEGMQDELRRPMMLLVSAIKDTE